jgi:hypothetical protein
MRVSNLSLNLYFAAMTAMLLGALAGCGSEKKGPVTVEVTGTVTLNGRPVEGASVVFTPDARGDDARLASQATTDHDGRFNLSTNLGGGKLQPGIVPGAYLVAITKNDTSAVKDTLTPPKNVLPQKYADSKASQLKADVIAGHANDFPFALNAD